MPNRQLGSKMDKTNPRKIMSYVSYLSNWKADFVSNNPFLFFRLAGWLVVFWGIFVGGWLVSWGFFVVGFFFSFFFLLPLVDAKPQNSFRLHLYQLEASKQSMSDPRVVRTQSPQGCLAKQINPKPALKRNRKSARPKHTYCAQQDFHTKNKRCHVVRDLSHADQHEEHWKHLPAGREDLYEAEARLHCQSCKQHILPAKPSMDRLKTKTKREITIQQAWMKRLATEK